MSLSNDQKALLKRAQAQAALPDDEYREAIARVSGMDDCRSSTDKRLTDEHVDRLMSYFEAIYWRKVDLEASRPVALPLQGHFKPNAFRQRGYWAAKNTKGNTSRDRYAEAAQTREIADLEAALAEMGCHAGYCAVIRSKVGASPVKYAAALKRTLEAKQRAANRPF